ncbi:hypothetical protein GCM10009716_33610 [Streptomyces sodiiphilus]|uniref:Chlorophyllase n=1 Tax=Streptomyces sodiiphilus TaxID=226217 RepID=A0ABN2PL93_9ACTN
MSTSTATATACLDTPIPVLSYSPVVLSVPGRPVDLQVRVSAPATGTGLPVVLLSHGHGPSNHLSSLNGYAPLANSWAAHGFVVVQPTHLTSRTLSHLVADAPGAPSFWRSRAEDMTHILDRLDVIENAVPQLAGRIDRTKAGLAGHSLGGFTAALLLGAGLADPDTGHVVHLAEPRIRAGVLPLLHHDHARAGRHRRQGRPAALHRHGSGLARRPLHPRPRPRGPATRDTDAQGTTSSYRTPGPGSLAPPPWRDVSPSKPAA